MVGKGEEETGKKPQRCLVCMCVYVVFIVNLFLSVLLLIHPTISFSRRLTNGQLVLLGEIVLRNLQVQRRGSFPYAAGDVVVGTVAGTEPTAVVTGLANRDTTEVGADTCC